MLNSFPINILVFISGGFADLQRYSYFIIFTSFLHPFSDSRETALYSLITTFFLFFYFLFQYYLFNFVNPRKYLVVIAVFSSKLIYTTLYFKWNDSAA